MAQFIGEVLGLSRRRVDGVEADLFELPDGRSFAVAPPGGMGDSSRSIGFLVDSPDEAIAGLTDAGVSTDEIAANGLERYVHFTRPTNTCTSSWNAPDRQATRNRRPINAHIGGPPRGRTLMRPTAQGTPHHRRCVLQSRSVAAHRRQTTIGVAGENLKASFSPAARQVRP